MTLDTSDIAAEFRMISTYGIKVQFSGLMRSTHMSNPAETICLVVLRMPNLDACSVS